jgi:hypothetical protein
MSTSVRQFALLMGQFFESSVIRFGKNQANPIASIHADGFPKLFDIYSPRIHLTRYWDLPQRIPE